MVISAVRAKDDVRKSDVTFHVAKDGNDKWSGALADAGDGDGPFGTLPRARDAVRAKKATGFAGAITVMVRGGKYVLEKKSFSWDRRTADPATLPSPTRPTRARTPSSAVAGESPAGNPYKGDIGAPRG